MHTYICEQCKKIFSDFLSNHRRFCSVKCKGIFTSSYYVGKKAHHYVHGKTRTEVTQSWVERNRGRKYFINARRKARRFGAIGSHTIKEWEIIKLMYKYMCLCCKRFEPEIKLTEDHIIPLARGGTNYISNIQPLCISCNSRKRLAITDYRGGVD